MAEPKTKPSRASVTDFIAKIKDDGRRRDCKTLMKMMKKATGAPPRMWGPSIVGYGSYHYKYATGREGDWFLAGFSPRAQALSVYVMTGLDTSSGLMKRLGKYTSGKSCLYIKRLEDVDLAVLEALVTESVRRLSRRA